MVETIIATLVGWVWYYTVTGLCLCLGVYYTLRLRLIQLRSFSHAFALVQGRYDDPNETGQITHFQALSAALSGTIGLGNIAGVSIAIAMGGPGAILWMWLVGFIGMATKYAECFLGTQYRHVDPKTGVVYGGPMYYIEKGLGPRWRPLALIYGFFLMLGAYGAGNLFQANQAASVLATHHGIPVWVTGLVLMGVVGVVIMGGIGRIGRVAARIVPVMCAVYLIAAIIICVMNAQHIPTVFSIIVYDAFTGSAVAGGSVGMVMIWGVRRGVFSNEAGLGSASVAHAAVKTNYPIREGVVATLGPLIDTMIVCTATAMVIIMSGYFGDGRYFQTGTPVTFDRVAMTQTQWHVTDQAPPNSLALAPHYSGNVLAFLGHVVQRSERIALDPASTATHLRFASMGSGNRWVRLYDSVDAAKPVVAVQLVQTAATSAGQLMVRDSEQWNYVVLDLARWGQADRVNRPIWVEFQSDRPWHIDELMWVQSLSGIDLTVVAFDHFFTGFGSIFLAIAVLFFAYSTLITWSYYGETAVVYTFGKRFVPVFKVLFIGVVFLGAVLNLSVVLGLSDLAIGLMVIPNGIALLMLFPVVRTETKRYFEQLKLGFK
jgi:AGCS family alanine or glycine:cation symporter